MFDIDPDIKKNQSESVSLCENYDENFAFFS